MKTLSKEKINELAKGRVSRLPVQKIDERTNEIIELFTQFLFSVGVRTSKQRAWEILKKAHRLPFEYLIALNEDDGIEYQGQGKHLSAKHGNQLMVIRELGRFELKAVSDRRSREKRPTIKYIVPKDLLAETRERIKVVSDK